MNVKDYNYIENMILYTGYIIFISIVGLMVVNIFPFTYTTLSYVFYFIIVFFLSASLIKYKKHVFIRNMENEIKKHKKDFEDLNEPS